MNARCRTGSLGRRARVAVPALAVLGALTGCSAPAEGQESTALPEVTSIPVILDSTHLKLPMGPYLLSTQEMDDLTTARDIFLRRCAGGFGVELPAHPKQRRLGPITYTERRYGLADPALAAEDGYHLGDRDARHAPKPAGPELSAAQELVLTGTPPPAATPEPKSRSRSTRPRHHGRQIPADGCLGEANRKLGGSWGDPEIVERIDATSVLQAAKDGRVVAVFRDWSACMKARGYRYAAPWDPANDGRFAGPHSSPTEVAVATADVACKQKTNVVGVWYAVDAAYQRAFIARHRVALDQVKKDKAAKLRLAAATTHKP